MASVIRIHILDPHTALVVKERPVNIYEREAEAYRLAGKPVPAHVAADIERWKKEHGV